jgi:hypothetical protein
MCRRIVLSTAITLLASSAVFAGGLDQSQIACIGSCHGAPFNLWCQYGESASYGLHQSISMVQSVSSVGHCGGTCISQSIHISSNIGCGPQQHGGCGGPGPHTGPGGCGQGCGITSQSCMMLSAHSTHLGGAGIMMTASQVIR